MTLLYQWSNRKKAICLLQVKLSICVNLEEILLLQIITFFIMIWIWTTEVTKTSEMQMQIVLFRLIPYLGFPCSFNLSIFTSFCKALVLLLLLTISYLHADARVLKHSCDSWRTKVELRPTFCKQRASHTLGLMKTNIVRLAFVSKHTVN